MQRKKILCLHSLFLSSMAKSTTPAIGDLTWKKSTADRPVPLTPSRLLRPSLVEEDVREEEEDAMDLDAPPDKTTATMPTHLLIPERSQQTSDSLRPPLERAAIQRSRHDRILAPDQPLLEYLTTQLVPTPAARVLGLTVMGPSGLPAGGSAGVQPMAPSADGGSSSSSSSGTTPLPPLPKKRGKKGGAATAKKAAMNKTAALLGTFGGDGAQDRLAFGRIIPMEVQLVLMSDRLQQGSVHTTTAIATTGGEGFVGSASSSSSAHRKGTGRRTARGGGNAGAAASTAVMRIGTATSGHLGGYIRWTATPKRDEYKRFFDAYFAKDRFSPAPVLPARGQDPATFGPLREIIERYAATSADQRDVMERGTPAMPRRIHLPQLQREYFSLYRMPVLPEDVQSGKVRLCRVGSNCLANREGRGEKGYVMREFLVPAEATLSPQELARVKPEPGLCIDCQLFVWTEIVAINVQQKLSFVETMNTFTVYVRQGEYGAHCMLARNGEQLSTGIEGFVPGYSGNRREYVPIPRDYLLAYGLTSLASSNPYYYAEVDMDFRLPSDTPTSH
jgi:hypothetical protein